MKMIMLVDRKDKDDVTKAVIKEDSYAYREGDLTMWLDLMQRALVGMGFCFRDGASLEINNEEMEE